MRNNFVRFVLMLLLTFSRKNFSYLFFSLFFQIMLENPAPPSLKFSSPMRTFVIEISSRVTSPSTLPLNQKYPPKNFCTLPSNHYYM